MHVSVAFNALYPEEPFEVCKGFFLKKRKTFRVSIPQDIFMPPSSSLPMAFLCDHVNFQADVYSAKTCNFVLGKNIYRYLTL